MAITPTPSSPGFRVIQVGPGFDLVDFTAAQAYVYTQNVVTQQEIICFEHHQTFSLAGKELGGSGNSNSSYYYIHRPVPGLDVPAGTSSSAVNFEASSALTLTMDSANPGLMTPGVELQGWKIRFTGTDSTKPYSLRVANDWSTKKPTLKRCMFLVECAGRAGIDAGDSYAKLEVHDCLIEFAATCTAAFIYNNSAIVNEYRNTYRRRGVAGRAMLLENYGDKKDCVYSNMGGGAFTKFGSTTYSNCISDNAADARSGFTIVAVDTIFASATDLRPKAGGPLIGQASLSAASTLDLFGQTRGTSPNVGAVQRSFAVGAPTGSVTAQPDPDGQNVGPITFSVTGGPTSAIATATPAVVNPGGAQTIFGVVTLGTNTGSVMFTGVTPGGYDVTITATNESGIGTIEGTHGFSIQGLTGNPQAPTPGTSVSTVTGVTVSPATATVLGGASQQFTATVQGQNNPAQDVTWEKVSGPGTLVAGLYTAVGSSSAQTAVLRARSIQDSGFMGQATVTIPAVASTFQPRITIPLVLVSGAVAANLTNLKWAWHDQPTPDQFTGPPTDKGSVEVTEGQGVLSILLPNSTKTASGQVGHIEVTDSDGNPATQHNAFVGPWAVD